jgi:hypothetical protein
MHDGVGIALIVAGAGIALATGFLLRTRAPAPAVAAILALSGLALGAGALLVQGHVSTTNWVVTLVALSFLVPAHVRVVLGPFGTGAARSRPPA